MNLKVIKGGKINLNVLKVIKGLNDSRECKGIWTFLGFTLSAEDHESFTEKDDINMS